MDVKVGDEVFVQPASYHGRKEPLIPARVVKVGRVWLDIELTGSPRIWRLRRDTQNENRDSVYQARFLTPDQAEQEKKLHAADEVLKLHGIDIRQYSRWCSPSQRIALAAALKVLAAELDDSENVK
jgi:hypothetical protein